MPRLSSLVLKTLAGLGITLPAGGLFGDWSLATQQAKIQASDKEASDAFGYSVSISSDGNTAILGAYYEDTGGTDAGAAYIFVRSGSTWTEQAKIQSSDIQAGDLFGNSVSISGDGNTAIVGAYYEDTGGDRAGSAYIFVRSGSTWTEQARIQASDKQQSDYFGYSVSISGDGLTAIVGAYYEDTGATDAGAVYIFTRSGSTWSQQAKIQASDKEAGDRFGNSVSISGDGNTAIVCAYYEDTGGTQAGAAYIFVRSGSTWTQQAKIQASNKEASDYFGQSGSISGDGNTAIVGANYEDTGATNPGAAYIFVRSGSIWTEQAKIQASDKEANDFFGQSVSISGDGNTAIVGANYEDTGGSAAGAAYIFVRSGSTWTEQVKIQASDKEATDNFGFSVSISSDGNTAIVGAQAEDTGASNAGAAYIFVAG
jgi:dsRNA-specific ribonuclease